MMKKTLWVFLLTVCIVFSCLAFTAQADGVPTYSVAASGGDYTSIESALADLELKAAKGELSAAGVKLVLTGEHTATKSGELLFGQETIFLPSGLKLPITVSGGTLHFPEGKVACANDYTFTNISIPFDDVNTRLYAGSGNVTMSNVITDLNGTASENKSYFYGDNYTATAFTGWDEDKLSLYTENGLFTSSMTLAHGFNYATTAANRYAAVGSSVDFSAEVGAKTVSADDTAPKLIVDGAVVGHSMVKTGKNPAGNAILHVKSGTIGSLRAGGHSTQSTLNGDMTVIVDGGTLWDFPRLLRAVTLNGDLNVTLKNVDLMNNTTENGKMIQIGFSSANVNGDINVYMENVKADRYYGALSGGEINGNVSVTAKNCEFSRFFYGGYGTATIVGNVSNTLENVDLGLYKGLDECPSLTGTLTTDWKNVTFVGERTSNENVYMGSGAQINVQGDFVNTLEEVTVPNNVSLYMGSYKGTHDGNITSTIKSGYFYEYLYGSNNAGIVKGTVTNNIQGGIFDEEVYLGGYSVENQGQIVNNVSGGNFQRIYLYCGTRGGKISNTTLDYTVKNTFSGGYFKGVWGGSGGGGTVQHGNIYNEITGGTFNGYNASKNNSFAGGSRNGKHVGNVKTLIRGGVFEGYVAGGSIPNDESYKKDSEGNTVLILAGGTFKDVVNPASRWGTYSGTTELFIDTEKAVEPLSLVETFDAVDVIASSEAIPLTITVPFTAKSVIARGKAPLKINTDFTTDTFTVETGAAAPTVYGAVRIGTLTTNGETVKLGAKTRITATEVVGEVNLHQTELWAANTYFSSPAGTVINLSEEEDAFGRVENKNGVVKGLSSALAGVAFVFDDTVSLRFAFDKEWVDSVKASFSFTAKAGTQTIVNGASFSDLILKDGYYTVVSDPLKTANYNSNVVYSGTYLPERSFKMTDVAATGIKVYDKPGQYQELGTLLKAFSNYAVAIANYENGTSNDLPYANLAVPADYAEIQEEMNHKSTTRGYGYMDLTTTAHVYFTGQQLILDDNIYVRYTLRGQELYSFNQSSAKVHNLHFWNGCEDITDTITKTWVSTSFGKGYYEITVDIPVYPSAIGNYIRFLVTEQATLNNSTTYVIDHCDQIDAMAESFAAADGFEELGKAFQYYLQASEAYYAKQKLPENFEYPEEFSAGFAMADISSYGYKMHMYSYAVGQIYIDPCYLSCLALWDGGELALYYSVDVRQCNDSFTKTYKALLAEEFGVDPDKIFFNATHNHSGPDTTATTKENVPRWYSEIFEPSLISATKQAILDLAPSEVYAGKANSAKGTNFVRRYVREDGSFTGIHVYETDTSSPVVGYESEADKELRTLRFERGDKKDIIFANWQGHAAHGANLYKTQFTGDFVYWLRKGVQEETGAHFIYCNGSSGNLNFTPKTAEDIAAKYFTNQYFEGIGKSLVGTVREAVAAEEKVNTGKFLVDHIEYNAPVKVDPDDIREKALTVNEACKAYTAENGAWTSVSQQRNYIFQNFADAAPYLQSTYHMSSILTRNNYKDDGTTHLIIDIFAFSFGDVAMGFVPYEQFDTNGKQMRDGVADLYKMTFSGGYTNGTKSYVPSNLSSIDNEAAKVHYGGYEVYTCRYEDGTGDGVAAALTESLRKMKGAN